MDGVEKSGNSGSMSIYQDLLTLRRPVYKDSERNKNERKAEEEDGNTTPKNGQVWSLVISLCLVEDRGKV